MKNLIIQSLETKGVLGQIRAELRSSVFKIVDEQDQQYNFGCGLKWENPTLYKILETKIGTLLAEIIRDFMEYFRMDYSLSIFIPECGISPERLKKEEIYSKVGLGNNEDSLNKLQLPFLYYIMLFFIQSVKDNPNNVLQTILKCNNDLEKKCDEIIEGNFIEYLKKNNKGEDDDIPLSNERENIPQFNNDNNYNNNYNNNKNNNNNNNNNNNENDIEENINEEINDSKNDIRGSNIYGSTISNAPDKSVTSSVLENFNYVEKAQNPE